MPADSTLVDRGVGEVAVAESLPEPVVDLFALLTGLGDPVTLLLVVATGYLLADHLDVPSPRMATAIALAIGGFALTLALKHALVLPRPPGAATDGYGFPSGHALGATVVYGGLAALLDDRRLTTAAAGLVVVVAASRVAIGVHYLVDVVVGVAVGVGYLAVALRLGPGRSPERVTATHVRRTFAVAALVGLGGVAAAVVTDTVVALAAAVGGLVGWQFVGDRVVAARRSSRRLVASLAVLPVVGLVAVVLLDGGVSPSVAGGLAGGVVALLLAIPALATSG